MGLDPSLELDDIPLSIDATLNELLRSLDATLIPLSRFDATLIPLMRFDSGSLFGIGGGGGFFFKFGLLVFISCINSSIILIKICTYVLIKYFGLYTF